MVCGLGLWHTIHAQETLEFSESEVEVVVIVLKLMTEISSDVPEKILGGCWGGGERG